MEQETDLLQLVEKLEKKVETIREQTAKEISIKLSNMIPYDGPKMKREIRQWILDNYIKDWNSVHD